MNSDIDQELFENQIQEFDKHLNLNGNYRIIFSGRFGIGKTTFLKHFFDMLENKEKYRAIHLFPVNYSVAENADIFEYIKYDIVAHLLSEASKSNITLDKITIPRRLAYPVLLSKRPIDVIAPLLHFLGHLGKVYDGYKKLFNELEEGRKEAKIDKEKALDEYLKEAQKKAGSPYEQDFYSQLIVELLIQWKGAKEKKARNDKQDEVTIEETSEGGKIEEEVEENKKDQKNVETVLIVDDLDRVDPQHIFRLLNVFAAHFDAESDHSHNKFGFDKVIFVCDEANIRSIFRHYYGIKADFNGYLDKFYSKEVYPFKIREDVLKKLSDWVTKFCFNKLSVADRKHTAAFTRYVLENMIVRDAINMRALSKLWLNHAPIVSSESVKFSEKVYESRSSSFVLSTIEILKWLIGNTDDLIVAINKCITHANKSTIPRDYLGDTAELFILPFLHYKVAEEQQEGQPIRFTYQNRDYDLQANFKLEESRDHNYALQAEDIQYNENSSIDSSAHRFIFLKALVERLYT